ncbi:hypothetical protein VC83_05918 [Pseudogymnoascus destructans]|nr:uncharacterized protein VC83_05918 [Pseudogymnoascus destructans]OAF57199.1 hypothetical protein VC83_05918 [Pseudogymnoascus destructans]
MTKDAKTQYLGDTSENETDAMLQNGTEMVSNDTNGDAPSQIAVPSWINGIEETGPSTFDVISPYTNTTCWTSTSATPSDALRAVDAASAAFPAWSATKPTARRDILLRAADLLEERTEANAEIMRTEMGADVGASQFFVVPLAIKMLRDVAGRITSVCGSVPTVEEEGQSAIVYKEPMGVILGIVPWNAPYVFGIRSAATALAGGNTTVLKSSDLSPRCYWAIGCAFADAGLPAGCLNIVSCRPADAPAVVNAMIAHPAVRKINFTGSTSVGRRIAKEAGMQLKPCLMELGGKNSAIVCEDANLDIAVQSVIAGAFLNSGQICMSTDRIILHSAIAPAFLAALKSALSSAPPSDAPTLVSAASKARVQALVTSSLAAGAHLIHGSVDAAELDEKASSIRLAPVVVGGAGDEDPLWLDESFASLAACRVVSSDEEAVEVANSGGYGLSAAVFTEDLRRGFRLAKKLESG